MNSYQSFKNHILEALHTHLDASQLYDLSIGKATTKSFAINNSISEKSAEEIQNTIKQDGIHIFDYLTLEEKYSDITKELFKGETDLSKLPVRYGADLTDDKDERSSRDQIKKDQGIETFHGDDDLVRNVCRDLINADPKDIVNYFWKKSSDSYYLFIVTEKTPEIEKLLKKIQ